MSEFPAWKEATWKERIQNSFCAVIAFFITIGMFAAGLLILGATLDGATKIKEQNDSCLKHAINGYDIKRCR